ncbi:MAG: DUF1492 domain-containing protein [Clostridiales bacterium]|nr:DUF1492 domain-containing protein [Clostridiales bacterium]
MTIDEKKDYLSQYRRLDEEIKCKMDELEQWKSFACRVTRTMSEAGGSNRGDDRIQRSYEKIEELRNFLEQDIKTLLKMREEISQYIDTIDDYTLRLLLRYHYINRIGLEEIAEKMNYCYRQVTRLHRKALQELQIPENVRCLS